MDSRGKIIAVLSVCKVMLSGGGGVFNGCSSTFSHPRIVFATVTIIGATPLFL